MGPVSYINPSTLFFWAKKVKDKVNLSEIWNLDMENRKKYSQIFILFGALTILTIMSERKQLETLLK